MILKNCFLYLLLLGFTLQSVSQSSFQQNLSQAAILLTKDRVTYDPSYFAIAYPNGDVPKDKGVCTDVIIRAYRKLNIDLQKKVHEDMKRACPILTHKGMTICE